MSTQHARATRHRARDVTTATRGNRPRGPACAERLSVTPARRGPRARPRDDPRDGESETSNTPTGHVDAEVSNYALRLSFIPRGPGYAYGSREPEVAKVGERARGLSTRAHTCRCHTNGHGKRRGALPPLTTLY